MRRQDTTPGATSVKVVAKVSGKGLFLKHVEPFLKKWLKKSDGPIRGVYKGKVWDMPNMGLDKGFTFTKRTDSARKALRDTFDSSARSNFLKQLDASDLKKAGLDAEDIALVKAGKVPDGYQVHHKYPLDDSGTNSFENLVLIKNSPDHALVTNHQRYTTEGMKAGDSRAIDWPTYPPNTSVWPPTGGGATVNPNP